MSLLGESQAKPEITVTVIRRGAAYSHSASVGKHFVLDVRYNIGVTKVPKYGDGIIRDVILIMILIIRDISFRKHIVGQSFQFGKRHVLYGMFYLANQFISLEIVVVAQARCKSIAHRFLMLNVEC